MAEQSVRDELRGELALIRIDDGKANALSPALFEALHGALDRAEKEAKAVVLVGRPGRFSAGFDLSVLGKGGDSAVALITSGAEFALRLYEFPLPVVAACSGHALAMGALVLLAADVRIGAEGAFKIGLNEVAIGMTLPIFGVEFARARLSKRHFSRAVANAEIYAPAGAVDAGFLDRVVAPESLEDEAIAEATKLAALHGRAHHYTKLRVRGDTLARIRASLAADVRKLMGATC